MKHNILRWFAVGSILLSPATQAQVVGFLGNFDVINDTGKTAHGFEIDLEGLRASDITDTFGGAGRGFPTTVERYGAPSILEYATGVKVIYSALYQSGSRLWNVGTPDISTSPGFSTGGESCWTGGLANYGAATPCDHFGVGTSKNPTKTTYSWLLESTTPGTLTNGVVNLPAPTYTVIQPQPQAPQQAPIVQAQIAAPEPQNYEFGDAVWVKVYTTELDHVVALEDLVGGNDAIKQARQNTEIEWQLLQYDSGKGSIGPGNGQLELGLAQPVGNNAASIIRRYEFYKFGGTYNEETHEAILVGNDSNPLGSDVGSFIGAQNGAVNLAALSPVPESHPLWMLLIGLPWMLRLKQRQNFAV